MIRYALALSVGVLLAGCNPTLDSPVSPSLLPAPASPTCETEADCYQPTTTLPECGTEAECYQPTCETEAECYQPPTTLPECGTEAECSTPKAG